MELLGLQRLQRRLVERPRVGVCVPGEGQNPNGVARSQDAMRFPVTVGGGRDEMLDTAGGGVSNDPRLLRETLAGVLAVLGTLSRVTKN